MAEASGGQKTAVTSYNLLGGTNQKQSEYTTGLAQFLNLRNLDFDVPNALSKRPGSTQAISANTSGPLNSVFEFQRLDGASWVVTGSDTAMFYRTGSGLTLLSSGWNNGQPADMLAFVNRLWMANGQKYESWSGVGSTALPAGLPCVAVGPTQFMASNDTSASWFLAGGATMFIETSGSSWVLRGIYVAYSYIRSDGYYGPADFLSTAKNTVVVGSNFSSGTEYFSNSNNFASNLGGATVLNGYGISAIAVWIAVDTISAATTQREYIPGQAASFVLTGNLGWAIYYAGARGALSVTLKPNADLSRFHLYTLIAPGTFFAQSNSGVTSLAFTFLPNFNTYTGIASGGAAFTGMNFCWFNTNTPKFLDINQNVMFMSGFSGAASTVWFSEVGLPETIEPEYNIEVRTNDGDVIRGHKTYNNQTIVFKENSFHKIIGVSPEEFELIELSTEYGCISDKTIIEYQEKLLFLDKKGIVEYNGASWDVISTPVEDIFRRMNLSAAREKACAVHQLYRNQVWFGIPVDGSTTNNITVVYDYLVKGWTFFDGFNPASFAMVQGELTKPTVWTGNYSGVLRYFSESFYGDNGSGITCLAYSSWEHGQQNETWIWRRLFLDVATVTGLTGTITGKLFSNYNTSTVQATFSMFQDAFQSRAEFGLPGKACAFEIAHTSASLPLLINGYTWARRFIRNV